MLQYVVPNGGIFGTMCLIGMLILLNRRLFDKRISKTSKFSDTFVLLYLFVQLLLDIPFLRNNCDESDFQVY
jgi:nitrate reductase gamma subunit